MNKDIYYKFFIIIDVVFSLLVIILIYQIIYQILTKDLITPGNINFFDYLRFKIGAV